MTDQELQGCRDAIASLCDQAEDRVGAEFREAVIGHIARQLRSEHREGLPQKPPTGDDAFHAFMRDQGQFTQWAARALEFAAKALKDAGKGHQASQVYQAHIQARERAKGLLGDVD